MVHQFFPILYIYFNFTNLSICVSFYLILITIWFNSSCCLVHPFLWSSSSLSGFVQFVRFIHFVQSCTVISILRVSQVVFRLSGCISFQLQFGPITLVWSSSSCFVQFGQFIRLCLVRMVHQFCQILYIYLNSTKSSICVPFYLILITIWSNSSWSSSSCFMLLVEFVQFCPVYRILSSSYSSYICSILYS